MVVKLALSRRLHLYTTEPILEEYERVLRSNKFSLDGDRVSDTLRDIRNSSTIVRPQRVLRVCPDATDNMFLECADTAGANYLVTGNKRHFPKRWGKTKVVNARELLEIIGPALKR